MCFCVLRPLLPPLLLLNSHEQLCLACVPLHMVPPAGSYTCQWKTTGQPLHSVMLDCEGNDPAA